jgi:hypothetical protein
MHELEDLIRLRKENAPDASRLEEKKSETAS